MPKPEFCPGCGNSKNNCVCSLGGSISKKEYQCNHYGADGKRCTKIGNVSPNIRGQGPWFCCVQHARESGAL